MLLVVAENRRNLLDVVNPHQIDKLAAGYCLREQVNNTMRRRLFQRLFKILVGQLDQGSSAAVSTTQFFVIIFLKLFRFSFHSYGL